MIKPHELQCIKFVNRKANDRCETYSYEPLLKTTINRGASLGAGGGEEGREGKGREGEMSNLRNGFDYG